MNIKVAAAALNQTPLAWDNNLANIRRALQLAREAQASVVCLPEMCISGYGCEDAFLSPSLQKTAWQVLLELLPDTRNMVVSLGLPVMLQKAVYNCACLVCDGRILGFAAKMNLAGDGLHYEPRWFKAWPEGVISSVPVHSRELTARGEYPIGDLVFDVSGVRIGFEICEDAWVASRPGIALSKRGVDLILNPSASHFAFAKQKVRERFVIEGSRAFGVGYLYANLLGNEAGRAIYDGSTLIASCGNILSIGPRFRYDQVQLTSAVIDLAQNRLAQSRLYSYRPELKSTSPTVCATFDFPPQDSAVQSPCLEAWENSANIKEEEFTRAVGLGLYDYIRKSHSRGLVLSLSGGADSSAIACLTRYMLAAGFAELGEKFWPTLGYLPAEVGDVASAMAHTLTTVYQATRNSGPVTQQAAESLAAALGTRHFHFDVDQLCQGYIDMVGGALGRPLEWKRDDIALQNIQARVRAPGVWMLANIFGALLVSTSNRSEAAVGYATMDGDTAGGLSPIAGIDKNYLRSWLRWVQSHGPIGLGPIPQTVVVNQQQPTAELRPPENKQTDEDDLMPYDLLDSIEKCAIRDKRDPKEVLVEVALRYPQYTQAQLVLWIERFFRLWSRNQWKRERYAPSFHLDDENLDPKTWCRFPILSGGFQRELDQLRSGHEFKPS